MNKRMIIMLVVCALVFGGIFGTKWFMGQMMSQFFDQMAEGQVVTVSATEAKRDNWALSLNAVGTVEAINGVQVTTEAAGVVESISFRSGGKAKQGDVLVKLRDDEDEARLLALRAAAAEKQSGFERLSRLYDEGNASEAERDLARSRLVQARAERDAQQERLAKKTIRAPFDGELGIRRVNIGEYISPGTPVVSLQSLAPIHINFSLPEQQMAKVSEGLDVRATLGGFPDDTFEGTITALEPGVDPATRNFDLQAHFENEGRKLRPGMFARISIRLPESEDVVVVPRTAVSFNPYGNSVYVITEQEAQGDAENGENGEPQLIVKRRFVKTGRTRGTLVAVSEGLEPGERVVTSGLLKLQNNAPVKIDNEGAPPEDPAPRPDNS